MMSAPEGRSFGRTLAMRLLWVIVAVLGFAGLVLAVGVWSVTKSYNTMSIGVVLIVVAAALAVVAISMRRWASASHQ
jgi:hypothetical protein